MSDYETIQRRRNMTVGIFVVAAVCALVGLIFQFRDLPLFVSKYRAFKVSVQFPTAPGVQENTPVRFCGYQVGRVTKVKPPQIMKDLNTGHFYHQTLLILSIDKKYDDIPANVEVKLMTRGLGSSYIELKVPPFDVRQPKEEPLLDGSLLQGSTGMTSEFFPEESQKKLDELVDGLTTVINNANDILGDNASKENFKSTLANVSEATQQAAEVLRELRGLSAAVANTSEQLGKTVAELRLILEKVNTGQGTAGRLINDGRLYENLLDNTQQLQILLEELNLFITESRKKGLPIKVK